MARNKYNTYENKIKPNLDKIEKWAKYGTTELSMMEALHVSKTSWANWKKAHPELVEALKRGRADIVIEVKDALLKRALGYNYQEKKIYSKTDTDTGKESNYIEVSEKHCPPDVAAINLALKNWDKDLNNKPLWSNDWQNYEIKKKDIELKKKLVDAKVWAETEMM